MNSVLDDSSLQTTTSLCSICLTVSMTFLWVLTKVSLQYLCIILTFKLLYGYFVIT